MLLRHSRAPQALHAWVSYEVPPDAFTDGGRFDAVSRLLREAEWARHRSCGPVEASPARREFLLRPFPKGSLRRHKGRTRSDRVIAWSRAHGYRVPVLAETLAFAAAEPERQREAWIVSLGEFAYPNFRWVPVLAGDRTARTLEARLFSSIWREEHLFLLVRRTPMEA